MDEWKEEARGLVAWRGCVGYCGRDSKRTVIWVWEDDGGKARLRYAELSGDGGWPLEEFVPDLEDPDVLAAFDRRLAIRLGCPRELASEGVVDQGSYLSAGPVWDHDGGFEWTHAIPTGPDRLLARVRAWKGVVAPSHPAG